jgi:ubiquinone/menaquinone biosynthesis C-methylase UbiE
MSYNIPIEKVYDKSGAARYNFVFYPFGIRDFIFRKIVIRNEDRILDAGCGYGILSKAIRDKINKEGLTGTEHHAFDISGDMLQTFAKMGIDEVDLRRLDVRDLPYDDDYFDLTVTSAMLEYVPDIEDGLISLRRCLKPGGKIYVFMSRKSVLNDFLFRPFGRPKCYSLGELEDIFRRGGFRNIGRHTFPLRSCWLNMWGIIIEGTK